MPFFYMSCPLCEHQNNKPIGEKNDHQIVCCLFCGFIHVNPMPKSPQLEELYDQYGHTESYLKKIKKKIFTSKHKLKKLNKYLNQNQNQFLDVGCSIGATVEAANRLGYEATGIDLDKKVIKQAQKLFPTNKFQAITTDELEQTNIQYDLIYCAEVVEHVPDPHAFMASLNKLLKTGAILYLTTPDAGHRKVPKDFVSWNRVTPPEHIGYFTRKTMSLLLEKQGFKVIKFKWSHRTNMRVICKKL